MREFERAQRVGLTAIALALLIRLYTAGMPEKILDFLSRPDVAAFLIYLETGRDVRFSASSEEFFPDFAESFPAAARKTEEPVIPAFSGEEEVELYYGADKNPDIGTLLARPLSWQLFAEEPAVLILHTHATESYTRAGEKYKESSAWRTVDEGYNLLSVGEAVAKLLNEAGIPTLQDRQMHDYPSYNGSYTRSRKSVREILEENPTISLILDLHRDASGEGSAQMRTRAVVNGEPSAQLMVVVGTNHKGYEENLSLGLKLHALLEKTHPGLMRPLQLRAQRFNQDLLPGALLIEVGAAGNTREEALRAATALAEGVIALARGSVEGNT